MDSYDRDGPVSSSTRLTWRSRNTNRLQTSQLPPRLRVVDNDERDATAPPRGQASHEQNMNQSVFGMIAAAGSTVDFKTRFDESSDTDDDDGNKDTKQTDREKTSTTRRRLDRSSLKKVTYSVPRLSRRIPRSPVSPTKPQQPPSAVVVSGEDDGDDEQETEDPRDAPMMSRLLDAEARFEDETESPHHNVTVGGSRADTRQATLIETRLQEMFGFDTPEPVIAEYPCWLLQSVLLQGYLYLTRHHICFYAYTPKKVNQAAKTGYIAKRGKSNPKYKRYWFELKGDVLTYFTTPSDKYFPQGHIDLRYGMSATLTDAEDKNCKDFSVTTDHRTYYFRADTHLSALEWVKTIQKTIFRSHTDGDSVKISLPLENVMEIEESPVVDIAETLKIRVVESGDSYAIDEYFFSFFSSGKDVLDTLAGLIEDTGSRRNSIDQRSNASADGTHRAASPAPRVSIQVSRGKSPNSPILESVRATVTPFVVGKDGRMAPRMSGEFTRPPPSPTRGRPERTEYGRSSFDRGRSDSREKILNRNPQLLSPIAKSARAESFASSLLDKETDSSMIEDETQDTNNMMSASQILSRSDVFKPAQPVETLSTLMSESTREDDETGDEELTRVLKQGRPPIKLSHDRRVAIQAEATTAESSQSNIARVGSPGLQDIVKAGAYPLQRAGALAGYLKTRSGRMSKMLATESMSYLEKVTGMWQGGRKHYSESEHIVPEDRDVDSEDEKANVGYGDRFRAHFALPSSEKLQATYFGYLRRVLPLYGKIYISNNRFCFRSLLPGTRTKLVLPLKDIENVDKEKGFHFSYSGLVIVIRGHEEIFFEFKSSDNRDDCTITLLRSLESVRYMASSELRAREDGEAALVARTEHELLQEARRGSTTFKPEEAFPRDDDAIYQQDQVTPILFDDGRASSVNLKPPKGQRITCLTIGSRGDVQPYIALCKGLLAEGHRPRIVTHEEFGPWIKKHGIEHVSISGDPAELMRLCVQNDMFSISFLREASSKFRSWIDDLLESAWEACQDSDILIESPSAMAGIHIAEALGIPYFRAFTMPWTRTRAHPHAFAVPGSKYGGAYNYVSYVMFDNVFWKGISGQINRWRNRTLNLPSTGLERMQQNKVPFLYNYSPHVVVPPLDYSDWVHVTGYWFLDEGGDYEPPQDLVEFIEKARVDKKKLVYIGFGSIVVSDPAALTRTVVDAVLKADVRCILSKGWSDRLGDPSANKTEVPLPDSMIQIKAAPHDWLFRQIDVAVHHGGAGTTGASLRAGVPTITKPFFGDQFFFGSRIEDLGVGICLKAITVSLLARALWEAAHSERMIVRARMLGEQIRRENGVETAIHALYRDLEYARTLIDARRTVDHDKHGTNHVRGAEVVLDDDNGITNDNEEESWTFVNFSPNRAGL